MLLRRQLGWGGRERADPNTQTEPLAEPLLCVRTINWPTPAVLMEGEPSVENTARPHFINQARSSPSHTKLTCRCSGHIQALEINHSGREQGSRQHHPCALLTQVEMCACEGGREGGEGRLLSCTSRPTCTFTHLQREAVVCDVINDRFSSRSFNLLGLSACGAATNPRLIGAFFVIVLRYPLALHFAQLPTCLSC